MGPINNGQANSKRPGSADTKPARKNSLVGAALVYLAFFCVKKRNMRNQSHNLHRFKASLMCVVLALLAWGLVPNVKAQGLGGSFCEPAHIRIDLSNVKHWMAGGAGASWHAMGPTAYWYKNLPGRLNRNSRGSGWGGNPPLEYQEAWSDLKTHARWLRARFRPRRNRYADV